MLKIKVTFIVPIFELANAGSENFAYRLITSLRHQGLSLSVITNRGKATEGLDVYKTLKETHNLIKKIRPDVIIDWGFNYPAHIHRLGGGLHRFFLEYSLDAYRGVLRFYKWLKNRSFRNLRIIKWQESLIKRENAIFIPNSIFSARQLIASGVKENLVNILYNAVDTQLFRPVSIKEKIALRKQMNFSQSDILILFIAHNLLLKNYALLKNVFGELQERYSNLKLLIIGKRKPRILPKNCFYLGEVSNIAPIYQMGDLLLHPTYFDSCSNVVLEAMSSGLPVVVSDRCGANELIEDGVSGYVLPVVPNGSPVIRTSWISSIEKLVTDSHLRESIGLNARSIMLKNDFRAYVSNFRRIIQNYMDSMKIHTVKGSDG